MISGNRRIPLVYNSSKKTPGYAYNAMLSRPIRIGCLTCPPASAQANNSPVFQVVTATPGNPGNGNLTIELFSFPTVELRVNINNIYSANVSSFLSAMASATTITIQKNDNPAIFATLTKTSATNNTLYWSYGASISGGVGVISAGDYVLISYS